MTEVTRLAPFDHTGLDYSAIVEQLLSRIDQIAGEDWTDRGETDIGRAILELFAFVNSSTLHRLDMTANELFLPTARQRGSVIRLANLIGYKVAGHISSSAIVKLSATLPPMSKVSIPKFTHLSTDGTPTINFYTWDSIVLENTSNGSNTISQTVLACQGDLIVESFSGISAPNQELIIANSDIGQNTLDVRVGGVVWEEVEDFLNSDFESDHFTFGFNSEEEGVIRFGDGSFGRRPASGMNNIVVRYLRSSGSSGNVGSERISKVIDTQSLDSQGNDQSTSLKIIDDMGNESVATISVTNDNPSSGGRNPESIDSVKLNAPASSASSNRAVTSEDYIVILRQVGGVAKSNAWGESDILGTDYFNEDENGDPTLTNSQKLTRLKEYLTIPSTVTESNPTNSEIESLELELVNKVFVTVAPTSITPTFINENLNDRLSSKLDAVSMIGVSHEIWHPHYVRIDIDLSITSIQGFSHTLIESSVRDALRIFFDVENRDFGQTVHFSIISNLISNVSGVDFFDLKIRKAAYSLSTEDISLPLVVSNTNNTFDITIDDDTDKSSITLSTTDDLTTIRGLATYLSNVLEDIGAIAYLVQNDKIAISSLSEGGSTNATNSKIDIGDGNANANFGFASDPASSGNSTFGTTDLELERYQIATIGNVEITFL